MSDVGVEAFDRDSTMASLVVTPTPFPFSPFAAHTGGIEGKVGITVLAAYKLELDKCRIIKDLSSISLKGENWGENIYSRWHKRKKKVSGK